MKSYNQLFFFACFFFVLLTPRALTPVRLSNKVPIMCHWYKQREKRARTPLTLHTREMRAYLYDCQICPQMLHRTCFAVRQSNTHLYTCTPHYGEMLSLNTCAAVQAYRCWCHYSLSLSLSLLSSLLTTLAGRIHLLYVHRALPQQMAPLDAFLYYIFFLLRMLLVLHFCSIDLFAIVHQT